MTQTRRINGAAVAQVFLCLCIIAEETGVDLDVDAHGDTVRASGAAVHVRAWVAAAECLGALHRAPQDEEPEH